MICPVKISSSRQKSLKDLVLPTAMPGISINTSATKQHDLDAIATAALERH